MVRIAGSVIVRQRPGTAKGFVFLSMEDETGIMNAIITPDTFDRYKFEVLGEPFLLIDGVLQNLDGVISVKAARIGRATRRRGGGVARFSLRSGVAKSKLQAQHPFNRLHTFARKPPQPGFQALLAHRGHLIRHRLPRLAIHFDRGFARINP